MTPSHSSLTGSDSSQLECKSGGTFALIPSVLGIPVIVILSAILTGCGTANSDDDFVAIDDALISKTHSDIESEAGFQDSTEDGGDCAGIVFTNVATSAGQETSSSPTSETDDETGTNPSNGNPGKGESTKEAPTSPDENVAQTNERSEAEKTGLPKLEPREVKLLVPEKTFRKEGREKALRVSFDDVDLLKVLNMEPVQEDAPKLMPDWLTGLEGKKIRIRGFMYPAMRDEGIEIFLLARDNEICCFGRNPKVYDLVKVSMKDGHTTDYIDGRPFDVIGNFHIAEKAHVAEGELPRLYSITDAVVISR